MQVAEAEAAFLKQLSTVATNAAQLAALMGRVVPADISTWQVTTDIQQLRKESQGLSRTLRRQKEVRGEEGTQLMLLPAVRECCLLVIRGRVRERT